MLILGAALSGYGLFNEKVDKKCFLPHIKKNTSVSGCLSAGVLFKIFIASKFILIDDIYWFWLSFKLFFLKGQPSKENLIILNIQKLFRLPSTFMFEQSP